MEQGMSWWQAMLTILLGNSIVLVPMVLNAHAGTKYGISFPVLCRASFGVRGANLPALLRAIVACGWFGIQTWIGGVALNALFRAAWPGWAEVAGGSADHLHAVLADPGRDNPQGDGGDQAAGELVGSAASRRRRHPASLGHQGRRRPWSPADRVGAASGRERDVLGAVPVGAHRLGGVLGHVEPQHPRLHPLRQESALPDAGPGAGPPDHDDGVRVHRGGGHQCDDRALREADLGPGRADRPDRRGRGDRVRGSGDPRWRSSPPTWRRTSSRRRTTSRT